MIAKIASANADNVFIDWDEIDRQVVSGYENTVTL